MSEELERRRRSRNSGCGAQAAGRIQPKMHRPGRTCFTPASYIVANQITNPFDLKPIGLLGVVAGRPGRFLRSRRRSLRLGVLAVAQPHCYVERPRQCQAAPANDCWPALPSESIPRIEIGTVGASSQM